MYFKELEQLFEGTFATGESKYNFLDVDHDDDVVQETQDEQAREAEVYVDIGADDYLVNSQRAHNTSSCTSVPKSTLDNFMFINNFINNFNCMLLCLDCEGNVT